MVQKIKGLLPLAISVAVLAALYVHFSLNFTFHYYTVGDLGNGLGLPQLFHIATPAAFVTWGFYFAAGGGKTGFNKTTAGAVIGSVAGLVFMVVGPQIADFPDFWGLTVTMLVAALLLVIGMALGEWFYVPAAFGSFASVVFWWVATGLDGWYEGGGGTGNTIAALGDPATAGTGIFGGVLSTPRVWVFVSVAVTLIIGSILGYLSTTIATAITPKKKS